MTDLFDLMFRDAFGNDPFFSYRSSPKITYPINITRYKDYISYKIAAIGLEKEDIAVNLEDRKLTVKGQVPETKDKDHEILFNNIKGSNFHLEFLIPSEYDTDKVAVALDKGLLTINIAKAESMKPKKLEIGTTLTIGNDSKLLETKTEE